MRGRYRASKAADQCLIGRAHVCAAEPSDDMSDVSLDQPLEAVSCLSGRVLRGEAQRVSPQRRTACIVCLGSPGCTINTDNVHAAYCTLL